MDPLNIYVQPLFAGLAVNLTQRLPEAECAITGGELGWRDQAPSLEIEQQFEPALGALAVAVAQADDVLVADLVGTDDHQQALLVVLEAGLEVDAVGPEVDVALGREIASRPALILLGPARLQSRYGARRQARCIRSQQGCQRFTEVARRDALEIEPGQQLLDRLGAPQVGRQDRGGEADAPASGFRLTVPDPRPAHGDTTDPGLNPPLRHVAVTHHATAAAVINEIRVPGNEGRHLRLHRLGQQTAGARPQHLCQRILDRNLFWMGK